MPGKELSPLTVLDPPPKISLLKAHKALPKRTAFLEDKTFSRPFTVTRQTERSDTVDLQGYASSERIHSWIPEPSLTQIIHEHSPPLTPPLNSAQVNNEAGTDSSPIDGHALGSSQTASSSITTPAVQRSPPTPETTPPRLTQNKQTSRSPRNASTRAESFETARENISSDEENTQFSSPSLHSSRQTWLKKAGYPGLRDIGLGLALELEDGEQNPTVLASKHASKMNEAIAFDGAGEREGDGTDLADERDIQKLADSKQRYQCSTKLTHKNGSLRESPSDVEGSPQNSRARSLNLHQRAESIEPSPSTLPIEQRAGRTLSPVKNDDFELDAKLRDVENHRLSQISATSTVVSAMVFHTPPQRRQTLRHTSKIADLTSTTGQSNRASLSTTDYTRRRLLRHLKTPEGGQRRAYTSGLTGNIASQSSREKSKNIMQPTLRPTTAPDDTIGYFDIPPQNRRIVSAYASTSSPKAEKRVIRDTPPSDHLETALRSPSETNNISRPNSSVSAALNSINSPSRQPAIPGQPQLQSNDMHEVGLPSPQPESSGDWLALRPQSALVTPFSVHSARSSTPGTLEVNEATAISIYPHTNKSILVVQQNPRKNSEAPEHSAIIAANAKFALPAGSMQPPIIHQPRQLVDSPLQNPRSPPQPPGFKIIPPTPANVMDIEDLEQKNHTTEPARKRLSAPLSRIRRAFSTRRYSESFVAPFTRGLSRRNTIHETRRLSMENDPDRNLHPFWRPRSFWDAADRSESSDSEFGNDGLLVGNSLGMPTQGIKTFSPPYRQGSLSQRLGAIGLTRRRKASLSSSDPHAIVTPETEKNYNGASAIVKNLSLRKKPKFYGRQETRSYEFIQPQTNLEGQAKPAMPRLGYQVQYVGFKGFTEKVKERREEARRERVREKLKGSIDVVRGL
ncbi:MAG: hypothetical protein Q9214_000899 [Letrouitia sp. 1 TL-2023]